MPRATTLPLAALAALTLVSAPSRADPRCELPPAGAVPFAVGETLDFALESLGAPIGTMTLRVRPGKKGAAYVLEARAKTATFAANFLEAEATVQSTVGRAGDSRLFQQTSLEAGVQRTLDVTLPPRDGTLEVRATKDGRREDYRLPAPAGTRDLLATLYAVRALPLKAGLTLCVPLFDGRRLWTTAFKVFAPETTTTHLGDFSAWRLEGTAIRADKPSVKREIQFWFGADAQRLPLAACTEVQDKPVCLNLRSASGPKRRQVSADAR